MDWRGLIAAILAGGLAFTLVVGVGGAVWQGRALGEKGGEVLIAICVAAVSAISTYLASRRNNHNGNNKRED